MNRTLFFVVKTTTPSDEDRVVGALVLAFAADPMARWTFAEAHDYLSAAPGFVRAFGGGAFQNGCAYFIDGYFGAALWLPPGVHPDQEAMGPILERYAPPSVQNDLDSIFEQMASFHPEEPHWHLPMIGVDPAHQGQGHGSALMEHALERCDREHTAAYLESSNPRNIPLYQRHGFEAIGKIQAGSSPTVTPMLRKAR